MKHNAGCNCGGFECGGVSFAALFAQAHAAGMTAGVKAVPTPMTVYEADVLTGEPTPDGQSWFVADGMCGFAWVSFAGNTPWGRWAKANGKATKAYPTGLWVWVGEFNQSVARKEAYARAFAGVLTAAGIKAYAGSRLD